MSSMIQKINKLAEKLYLIIYQITIVFTLIFYLLMKVATGHKFAITNEEICFSSILFLAFVLSGLYKENKSLGVKTNRFILCLLLVFSIITFVMSLYFLYYTFTFDYEFREQLIFILIAFFIVPVMFSFCNFYLIQKTIKELRNKKR